MDRMTSLEVFARVVEAGGFSAAARRLGMSVTMASNHVQALEARLGVRLLNRTTRRVSLTEVGRTYYERSSQILHDLDEADRAAGALQSTPRGILRLYTTTHLMRFLSPVVVEYLRLHPEVSIDVTAGEPMIDLLEAGFDLAIRTLPINAGSLIVRRLAAWRHVLCCAPSYRDAHPAPTHPADLARHNCLRYPFYPYGDEWRFEGPDGKLVSVRVTGRAVSNSGELLRVVALDGQAMFLAPSFMVADDLVAGRLVRLLPDYRPVAFEISALYPHRQQLSAKVRVFIDLLAERFAEHRKWVV
jgi:DNA-binding transcriptional LysR family regulator